MGLFDTTADAETVNKLQAASKILDDIIERATTIQIELEQHLTERPGRAFPIVWISDFNQMVFDLHNEVARANGACLVRSTNKEG